MCQVVATVNEKQKWREKENRTCEDEDLLMEMAGGTANSSPVYHANTRCLVALGGSLEKVKQAGPSSFWPFLAT
jgi:hypothetical protein